MALSLGGVSFGAREQPYDWDYGTYGDASWSEANPYGFTGRIMRRNFIDSPEVELHCRLTSTTWAAVQALANAGSTVAFVWSDTDIDANLTVLIKRFHARKSLKSKRLNDGVNAVFDTEIVLVVLGD